MNNNFFLILIFGFLTLSCDDSFDDSFAGVYINEQIKDTLVVYDDLTFNHSELQSKESISKSNQFIIDSSLISIIELIPIMYNNGEIEYKLGEWNVAKNQIKLGDVLYDKIIE